MNDQIVLDLVSGLAKCNNLIELALNLTKNQIEETKIQKFQNQVLKIKRLVNVDFTFFYDEPDDDDNEEEEEEEYEQENQGDIEEMPQVYGEIEQDGKLNQEEGQSKQEIEYQKDVQENDEQDDSFIIQQEEISQNSVNNSNSQTGQELIEFEQKQCETNFTDEQTNSFKDINNYFLEENDIRQLTHSEEQPQSSD
ncbi:hypothetical protein ABPG74_008015 [Tetrahymena malaccensis]